ncbi:MAG TPA: isochorismatase family protein [Candidatus Avamphibacillus sp.]|nr:isochorismatase family protein [Candidatus Avamphibacillus sp.]
MKALLVIDAQNVLINEKDFTEQLTHMKNIITDFKAKDLPVIFMRHVDDIEESPFYRGSEDSEIHPSFNNDPDYMIEKQTPSSFFQTELASLLEKLKVRQVFITGFNTEFCCMFTAISAFDRGYDVTFIEDATGSVNDENTYEMKGLDIPDFVGTALHWSNVIEVLMYEEYVEEYKGSL